MNSPLKYRFRLLLLYKVKLFSRYGNFGCNFITCFDCPSCEIPLVVTVAEKLRLSGNYTITLFTPKSDCILFMVMMTCMGYNPSDIKPNCWQPFHCFVFWEPHWNIPMIFINILFQSYFGFACFVRLHFMFIFRLWCFP